VSTVEVFLDDTPGGVRGVLLRDGRCEHLLIQNDDDVAEHRLGARCVGRIVEVQPALKGAFVDLGVAGADVKSAFLPFRAGQTFTQGQAVEVEVAAEPREQKGAVLRLIGAGQGAPRLVSQGPSVIETLRRLAPDMEPTTGPDAIRAGMEAEEEAVAPSRWFPEAGLDLAVERTRALIAVDLDLAPAPGLAGGGKGRDRANRLGLFEAARLIRLRRWGGLVAIDLVGTHNNGEAVLAVARQAFAGDPDVVFGPLNRFGVLQLSLPWRRTPLEEVLHGPSGRRRRGQRAQDVARALRLALLSDTTTPRITACCASEDFDLAAPLVAQLGPRAGIRVDATRSSGDFVLETT
jgi:Ribonuclease G/E